MISRFLFSKNTLAQIPKKSRDEVHLHLVPQCDAANMCDATKV